MLSINTQNVLGAFIIVSLFIGVHSHSYVTTPQSRSNQKQSNTGCRGPNCLGPCDVSLSARSSSAAVHSASRGDTITIQWPRNNHAGGFIRFAWSLTSQSENHASFDQHVQQISCHEVGGCHPDDPSNPNGGDSGPSDGSSRACTQTLTVPADLSDGLWTLQWAWFGGAFSLGDYYSCVDYSISGGALGSTPVPTFVGGDYSYPNQQKCKFFNTDRLHVCVNEPCSNPIFTAAQAQSGVPAYVQQNFPSTVPSTPPSAPAVPSTTAAAPVTRPMTTAAAPVTPVARLTTSSLPAPVPAPTPATTGVAAARPSTSTTSSSSASCVSGHMKCLSDGSYSTCNHEVWGPSQSCGQGSTCSPSGDFIYCIVGTPISTPTTPSIPAPVTPTPVTPAPVTPTPVTPSTPSSPVTGSCTLGYQQCVGSNTYQTCGNGRDGPVWAAVQQCQAGLSCHSSSTANNIYCY